MLSEIERSTYEARSKILTLDLNENGLEISLGSNYPILKTPRPEKRTRLQALDRASIIAKLQETIIDLEHSGVWAETSVILGGKSDPFEPFEKFDLTLKILETIASLPPAAFTLQTRSPLAVLGIIALKAMGEKATVIFGLETELPHCSLPRIEERQKAVRALEGLAVKVQIQTDRSKNSVIPETREAA